MTTFATHPPLRSVRPTAAWAPAVVSGALVAGGVVLAVAAGGRLEVEDAVDGAMLVLFPVVGGALLRRGEARRLAHVFCAVGVVAGLAMFCGGLTELAVPGRAVAGLLASVGFLLTLSLLMNALPLLFPDGRLPSRRWRPVAVAAGTSAFLVTAGTVLAPGPVDEDSTELGANPLGVAALGEATDLALTVGFVGFAGCALLALASLVARRRHASAAVRRQLRVLATGVGVLVALFLLDSTLQGILGPVYGVVAAVVALGAVPAASWWALLRRPGAAPTATVPDVTAGQLP